jgi:hypothetical protein
VTIVVEQGGTIQRTAGRQATDILRLTQHTVNSITPIQLLLLLLLRTSLSVLVT